MADEERRDGFLAAVARALDASPAVEADVRAELAAHLDDEAAEHVAHGVDSDAAERRALQGLGDPRALGINLRRARRTPRAALALAGGGAIAIGGYSLLGVVLGMLAVLAADALARGLGEGIRGLVPAAAPGAYSGFAAIAVGLTYAAHLAPSSIASAAGRSVRSLRRGVAWLAVLAGLPLALLLPGQELDAWLAVGYALAPLAVAAAALRAPAGPTLRPGAITLAVGAVLLAAPLVAWPSDAAAVPAAFVQPPNVGALGRPAADVPAGAFPAASSAWTSGADGAATTGIRFDDLNGWHGLAVELWALERGLDGAWRYAPGPLVHAPFAFEGMTATATVVEPRPRIPTWVARAIVGIAGDGVRSLYGPPDIGRLPPWRGSVLDWWSGR